MKYFIPFMLFFLTNCIAPTAISAAINSKNTAYHSPISATNMLIIKEKPTVKKVIKKIMKTTLYFIIAITLMVCGIVLFIISANAPLSGSGLTNTLPQGLAVGLDEFFFGGVLFITGTLMLLIRVFKNRKNRKQTTPSVFEEKQEKAIDIFYNLNPQLKDKL